MAGNLPKAITGEDEERNLEKFWRHFFVADPPCGRLNTACDMCCWHCKTLPECFVNWDKDERTIYCPRVRREQWCDAVYQAYRKYNRGMIPNEDRGR